MHGLEVKACCKEDSVDQGSNRIKRFLLGTKLLLGGKPGLLESKGYLTPNSTCGPPPPTPNTQIITGDFTSLVLVAVNSGEVFLLKRVIFLPLSELPTLLPNPWPFQRPILNQANSH